MVYPPQTQTVTRSSTNGDSEVSVTVCRIAVNLIFNDTKAANSYFKDDRGEEQLKGKTGAGTTNLF